ncbi:hypothetical protein HW555_005213, partial [Spodoptera exigua]
FQHLHKYVKISLPTPNYQRLHKKCICIFMGHGANEQDVTVRSAARGKWGGGRGLVYLEYYRNRKGVWSLDLWFYWSLRFPSSLLSEDFLFEYVITVTICHIAHICHHCSYI